MVVNTAKYNIQRLYMFKKAIDMTQTLVNINTMFDMACNNGYWLNTAKRFLPNTKFTGMDTQNFSNDGWAEFKDNNINFLQGNSLSFLENQKHSYDMVLSMGIMYYYSDIHKFIKIITDATTSTVLIDTFCYNKNINEEKKVKNPYNSMVNAAKEETDFVTIPTEEKIIEYLDNFGFESYKVDEFTESYDESVGQRLNLDIKRSAILGVKRRDYIGQSKHKRIK